MLMFGHFAGAVTMAPMPVMHEHVHQRACREEQPGQPGQHVGPVLGNQEKRTNEGEHEQPQLNPWSPSAFVVPSFFRHGRNSLWLGYAYGGSE
jgi:hypothetical protein